MEDKQDERALSNKPEQGLVNTLCDRKIEGIFGRDEEYNEVLEGFSIAGEKFSFKVKKEMPDRPTIERMIAALKEVGGSLNADATITCLLDAARSFPGKFTSTAFNYLIQVLQDMKPADAIETRLVIQHVLLSEQGYYLLRAASKNDMVFQSDFLFKNAAKFITLSQQAINTLTKYKTKGQQTVNVIHLNDQAKAIVANTVATGGVGQ